MKKVGGVQWQMELRVQHSDLWILRYQWAALRHPRKPTRREVGSWEVGDFGDWQRKKEIQRGLM